MGDTNLMSAMERFRKAGLAAVATAAHHHDATEDTGTAASEQEAGAEGPAASPAPAPPPASARADAKSPGPRGFAPAQTFQGDETDRPGKAAVTSEPLVGGYVLRFEELDKDLVASVGGKNASLGEMYQKLSKAGIKVPNGFATTAQMYRDFLQRNGLEEEIASALEGLDLEDTDALHKVASRIRGRMVDGSFSPEMEADIVAGYRELERQYGDGVDVAVRSSATAEDLPTASFAGQQETYLNISGVPTLLRTIKRVLASLFTDRAISYRVDKGFEHMSVALSVGVQKMVRSDLAASGVIFTIDTESGFEDVIMIASSYGLGENVVQGSVNPDEFLVFKQNIPTAPCPIVRRHLGEKAIKMVYQRSKHLPGAEAVRNVQVKPEDRARFSISDAEVMQLATSAALIEAHYQRPMDIEWAKDGKTGELFIVQARPETVHSQRNRAVLEVHTLEPHNGVPVLAVGRAVGARVGEGRARVILDAADMHHVKRGEVIVTDMTDPDWEPVMKIASAIVTNRGGRVCHAAIVARELGIPAVVGTGDGTATVPHGEAVTVSCVEGDEGFVYRGKVPCSVETLTLDGLSRPQTKMMLIVGNPDVAFGVSAFPNDGVGLARLEFIIANHIGIHPSACLEYDRGGPYPRAGPGQSAGPPDPAVRAAFAKRVAGYASATDFYTRKLAEGIATIGAAFYPKPVVVRLSDFKTNEYRHLLGGDSFEPPEENPMIGFRGAGRYNSPEFRMAFEMECAAARIVREQCGLDNVRLMIPFCRTVTELDSVLQLMRANGLERGTGPGPNGLQVYIMCEIPSNALLAEEFLARCDGFSIGSNDLTQLTLGCDRDSGVLSGYDERDPSVLRLMAMAIDAAKKAGKYCGICGQAPSDFPEVTRFLVENGIQSLALQPDSLVKMTKVVLEAEGALGLAPRVPISQAARPEE